MFDKKMKLIGVSILVCLAAIVAVPAFAAGSTHQGFQKNGANPPVMNATMETKLLGFAEDRIASLQQKGVDVTDLTAALASAKSAIQNADATAFRDAMKTFRQDIPAGIRNGSITGSALQGNGHQDFQKNRAIPPVLDAHMETKMLDRAQTLTITLQQKGVAVTGLNAVLANAKIAIENADVTAFKNAMKTFNQDIQAGIRNGSIDKSVLPQPGQRPAPALGTRTHPFTPTKNHSNSTCSAPRV